jgi:tyrosine-protein kinase Etk/Wzc
VHAPVSTPPPSEEPLDTGYAAEIVGGNLGEEEFHLGDLLGVLAENKWRILSAVLLAFAAGTLYLLNSPPIYQVDALLQIEENKPSVDALDELTTLTTGNLPLGAEIEIIRSRSVIGQAARELDLEISAAPLYLPLIGKGIAQHRLLDPDTFSRLDAAFPWLHLSRYARGSEQLKVETFEVPPDYIGKPFTLVADTDRHYRLLDPQGREVVRGKVGEALNVRRLDETLSLYVSRLEAHPGTRFHLTRSSALSTIHALQGALKLKELGKSHAWIRTGLVRVSMEHPDPVLASKVINTILDVYVRKNVEHKSAEAQKTLTFLEQQLPSIKEALDAAEAALNSYRLQKGSVDLPKETQVILEKNVELEAELLGLTQKRKELLRRFTPQHPTIVSLDTQLAQLKTELKKIETKVQDLPDTQQTVLRLSRDVEVTSSLYTSLLNNAQELRIAKAGTVGNVRVVDYAVPTDGPIAPRRHMILAVSLALGLFLGTAYAFARQALSRGVEDPDLIERRIGIPVYVTIPHSNAEEKTSRSKRGKPRKLDLVAQTNPQEPAMESLRSLRTTLHFALLEAGTANIVMITSPSPGVGKTFITANFGALLATTGKRVALVDGDLRKGRLHEYFGLHRAPGFSDLILGTVEPKQAVHATDIEGLSVIPTGELPPNPSELLLHERCAQSLGLLGKHFDYLIIDTPPILAVTDAAIVGRLSAATLMVLRAGHHSLREIELSAARLQQAGIAVKGLLLNDIKLRQRHYGYGGDYYYGKSYAYQYSYDNAKR